SSFSSQVFEYLYLAISRAFRVFILSGLLNFLCPSLCVFQPAEYGFETGFIRVNKSFRETN
ncbi:hypothetical protein, partial [Microcystis aeruginosa]|uniref:hypothetical protein n=1 Tax=Microcystis aeruginosa TaxID=1126 RepID=UPI001C12B0DE